MSNLEIKKLYKKCLEFSDDATNANFTAIVAEFVKLTGETIKLADYTEAARSTIGRWASGFAFPLKGMQAVVVKYIRKYCESKILP